MWTGGALHNIKEDVLNRVQLYRLKEACSLEGERALAWIRPFLESYGPSHSVQMVEAHQILPELFTHHGVGTLVSLGYHIIESDLSHCDAQALRRLLERGFGRPLKEGYFENLACGSKVLLEEKGRGVIVLEPWDDVLYLDKLVVEPQFLGQGLGSILLEELTQRLEELSGQGAKLCWRARMDNPYLSRYATMVHGFSKHHAMACGTLADGHYVYHFIGLKGQALDRVIEKMKSRPSSFS
jgi:GNAT superfamily N-acetyltransferase